MPEGSISILGGNSLTYYYKLVIPGTYMYHCHREAAEHMQMGMLGNLFVRPAQDRLPSQTFPGGFAHTQGNIYGYNDADGSTFANSEVPIQLGSTDAWFHNLDQGIQNVSFSIEDPKYAQLNGRGYPDTANPGSLPVVPPQDNFGNLGNSNYPTPPLPNQNVSTQITATHGQKVLLRFSSLDTTKFFTLTGLGLPMKVVGHDGRLLEQCTQVDPHNEVECLTPSRISPVVSAAPKTGFGTSSITLGGGMSDDVLVDLTNVTPGTYFLYTTNLNYLANDEEDYGGMMTELVVQGGGRR
jgi:FtsP/CotA-like multicopper oxidase with cupredoxin domain